MAYRVDASNEFLVRTANVPNEQAFSMCGWFNCIVDRNDFQACLAVDDNNGANSNYTYIETDSDGTSLRVYSSSGAGSGSTALASLTVGTPFFLAITATTAGANSVTGYYRTNAANSFTTATVTGRSFTQAAAHVGSNQYGEWFNGRFWNIKCWDRVLTAAELLVESYYRRVMYPANINFHWPLDRHDGLVDFSGNARNPSTGGGTGTTEDGAYGLWRPSRKIVIPPAAAPGGFQAAWAQGANVLLMPGRA